MKAKAKSTQTKKAPAKLRDLRPTKNPKGGVRKAGGNQQDGVNLNHNETMVTDAAF